MADVKESALSTASDCAYVRALDSNGNSIRISKADLASVVGGLLSSLKMYPFMYHGVCSDFNNATEIGYYHVSSIATNNIPNGAYGYGTLLVVGNTDNLITQLYIVDYQGKIYKRNRGTGANDWRDWYEFTGTNV